MTVVEFAEKLGEESAGGLLDQVQRMIETFAAAKEGVRHVLRSCMRREVEEAADLVARIAWRKLDEFLIVRAVHRQQSVEASKIGRRNLPRALRRDIDAAIARRRLRTGVGRLAGMPVAETGGVDVE